jgi:hypothetical protein
MADEMRKSGAWGKPPAPTDQQSRTERRHGIISNLLTVLFTAVIIAGGVLMPTLLYPYLDFYRNDMVQLARPSESTISEHVFEEPVTLYPWNLYAEERLRSLSSTERDLLEGRGIPGFIVATLRDHGMQIGPDESSYHTQIINSFRYLEPRDDAESGCFVLVDADINADEDGDIRCAVDPSGNIISLLLTSAQWDAVQIEAPIGVAAATPEGEGEVTGENTTETTEGVTGEEGEGEEGADTEGAETTGETPTPEDAEAEGTEDDSSVETEPVQPLIEFLPAEDQYLWAFAYATAREARAVNQQDLFFAFRQLELNYERRYGYPFTMLLPLKPSEPEELPEVEYTALTPTFFATGDYLLSIYDLPTGERLVLYLDPNTLHCRGFNLLRF